MRNQIGLGMPTVGINPILSDLNTPQTSKLGWRYFEANRIDRNELQIPKNSQKGTGLKMAEKLNNLEKFERVVPYRNPTVLHNACKLHTSIIGNFMWKDIKGGRSRHNEQV